MRIGQNWTRYDTDDLQALIDTIEGNRGRLTNFSKNYTNQAPPEAIDVAYWKGDATEGRRWAHTDGWRENLGPWFTADARHTKSERLIIPSPSDMDRALTPLEALARAETQVLPDEAKTQVGAFLAYRMGLRQKVRGQRTCIAALQRTIAAWPSVGALNIRINKKAAAQKPTRSREEQISTLRQTFRQGTAANRLREGKGYVFQYLRVYVEQHAKTEKQRARLLKKGVAAEPYQTPEEFLQHLLKLVREGKL